jgi:hypothetical protein
MRSFSEFGAAAVHDKTETTAMNRARVRRERDLRSMYGSPDDKVIGILPIRIAVILNPRRFGNCGGTSPLRASSDTLKRCAGFDGRNLRGLD